MIRPAGAVRSEGRGLVSLAVFIVVVASCGAAVGISSSPGVWYAELTKPAFTVPGWVFGAVWFVLYVILALVGWTLWLRAPRSLAMGVWVAQLVVNLAWPPTFFVLHLMWPAFGLVLGMIGLTLVLMFRSGAQELWVDWYLVPYLVWLLYSALLNGVIAAVN